MALNVGRWIKYAQAKLEHATRSGHHELDELEAERAAQVADRPWLASDQAAPTFDEARARIEWEAEEQRRREVADAERADAERADAERADAERAGTRPAETRPVPPDRDEAADVAGARLELDRRQREAAHRLDAMRAELGLEPPPTGDGS